MKHLASVHKYFLRYKWRLLLGILFVTISNLFAVLPPVVIRNVIDQVQENINSYELLRGSGLSKAMQSYFFSMVFWNGLLLLGLALLRGIFMFFMRQTIIVMSRLIEFDQKNEIYTHYQQLHTHFYKTHFTGDLMNRMSEDVSRVRMYTGPAIMYSVNVIVLTVMCIWGMMRVNPQLTLYVIAPLPVLAISLYYVNKIIYKKSGRIQAQLSGLTTTAQESYSGIRVIKAFVQEKNMLRFFDENSEAYRKSTINLSLTEAVYFPSMNLFIGLSMLATILIGGYLAIKGQVSTGNIAEFVIYINLLTFPISSIGSVASMIQRAGASQKRIDEFLDTRPEIVSPDNAVHHTVSGDVVFHDVSFTYMHTGIKALNHFSLHIKPTQKIAVIGKTGSGKSTLAHMLLRMYDPQEGSVLLDDVSVKDFELHDLRRQIAYAPQEAFLFSDTIYNNIKFGRDNATEAEVKEAARLADLEKDISGFEMGYETVVGERGVMLSGGQKQRMILARALLKNSKVLLLDECLSAVDTQTEKTILHNLQHYLSDKTTIVITHRIFTSWTFDQIILLDDGSIAEQGTHEELMQQNGRYAKLYRHQTETATA
ncbi:ABC transporter ATP-binding protein [Chitinophagaceae bacterium MMS25-I14]